MQKPAAQRRLLRRPVARRFSVASAQLVSIKAVQTPMRRIRLTAPLAATAAGTMLFAGIALAADRSGTDHRDYIKGTPDSDVIDAKAGADFVRSLGGNDTVNLGPGRDIAWLGAGDDTANGGNGADWIVGGEGNDTIAGDAG